MRLYKNESNNYCLNQKNYTQLTQLFILSETNFRMDILKVFRFLNVCITLYSLYSFDVFLEFYMFIEFYMLTHLRRLCTCIII